MSGPSTYSLKFVVGLWEFCIGLNFCSVESVYIFPSLTGFVLPLYKVQKEAKISIMLLLVWVECSVSFLFMKACQVRARAPHKPRFHLQSRQQVVQLVELAFSHVHCLSESSLTLWRLGPLF